LRDLAVVIEVRIDVQRMMFAEHRHKFVRDALRQNHRRASANSDDLHMIDLAQLTQNEIQGLGLQHQRIAA